MAVEMMAIAGMAPATAAQPGAAASSAGAPEGGEGFAGVIAAALSATPGEESPAGGVVGTDVSALLAGLAESLDGDAGVPVAMGDGSRLDRDAEAEGLQGALASMLLGAFMRQAPLQATPDVAVSAVAAAAAAGVDGLVPAELMASVGVQAQGSAGAVTGSNDTIARTAPRRMRRYSCQPV